MGLSPPVQSAVHEAIATIEDLINSSGRATAA
jgi:Ni,Fe-hydrogenase maturation factor